MSGSVADPFSLTSYSLPSRSTQALDLSHVSVTHGPNSHDGILTITVQAEGIHIFDLSSFHPVSSHTLGPSILYCTPAVSRISESEKKRVRTTFVAIDSAPDVKQVEKRKTIWIWNGDFDSTTIIEKKSVLISHDINTIYAPSSLPSYAILLSPTGTVTLLDSGLLTHTIVPTPDPSTSCIKSWAFPRNQCRFISQKLAFSSGTALICLLRIKHRLNLRTTLIAENGNVHLIDSSELGVQAQDFVDTSFDPTGYLSLLTRSGEWNTFSISWPASGSPQIRTLPSPLYLSSLSFISLPQSSSVLHQTSLLAVGSSHVLLSGLTTGTPPELVLLLWDLQFSVLLASHTLKIPSSLASVPPSELKIQLIGATPSSAILVLQPRGSTVLKSATSLSSTRSTVLVVPFSVPPSSSLRNALGRSHNATKWVTQQPLASSVSLDDSKETLLRTISSAINQDQPEAATTAFFAWVEQETENSRKSENNTNLHKPNTEDVEMSINGAVAAEDTRPKALEEQRKSDMGKSQTRGEVKLSISHQFTSRLLHLIFRPAKPASVIYPSKILIYLLERRLVSYSMVQGGVIEALLQHEDWESIQLALTTVPDIPESCIISVLKIVVASHRSRQNPTSMDIDLPMKSSFAAIPSVPRYLALCITYPTSAPHMRAALKSHFPLAEDLILVLEVLEKWVDRWCSKSAILGFDPATVAAKTKRASRREKSKGQGDPLPNFEFVLSFLQTLLDSSFLTFLQYPPSHPILKRLASYLPPQLSTLEDLEYLRGPLQPYVHRHVRSQKKGEKTFVDWRKQRKELEQTTALAIGPYQVEELLI